MWVSLETPLAEACLEGFPDFVLGHAAAARGALTSRGLTQGICLKGSKGMQGTPHSQGLTLTTTQAFTLMASMTSMTRQGPAGNKSIHW